MVDLDLGKNFLKETMKINKIESSDSENDEKDLIANELEAMFSGGAQKTKSHKNLKTWNRMGKSERAIADVGPEIPDSLKKDEGITYLGADLIEENEQERQENQRILYDKFKDENGRNESLMEQHKRQNEKSSKPRREFDRKRDLRGQMNLTNSENSLTQLKNTGNLDKRFGTKGKFI